jgi:large subunit ribosomal protein L32e
MVSTIKPKLGRNEKKLLKKKVALARKRPAFRRQEWFRYVKLGDAWRKPRGKHSKQREKQARRGPVVDAGFRGPKSVRGLHPSGFRERMVCNLRDLMSLDRQMEAARISSSVGSRKKEILEEKAEELGIRILNPSGEKQ